jgi:cell division protein FtsN
VGGTLVGLFVGIALGLGLAAAAAYYVMRAGNPYQSSAPGAAREPAHVPGKSAGADASGSEKPRFDFYKILPGVEEPRSPPKTAERGEGDRAALPERGIAKLDERAASTPAKAAEPSPRAPPSTARIWLQAGSFAGEADAENLKAQLALSGLEATLQPATMADRSVRYRVRLGPYDNIDEATRVKSDLAKRGFDATVIK